MRKLETTSSSPNVRSIISLFKTISIAFLVLLSAFLPPGAAGRPVLAVSNSTSSHFSTPLTGPEIDSASSAEWVDGTERPISNPAALRQVIWTQSSAPTGGPVQYGNSQKPGLRHLRLAFSTTVNVGSVLVRGGGQLSVLRPNASGAGNLSDDSLWLPATRIVNRQPVSDEVEPSGYALWSLPPGTRTRALRFTHDAAPTDTNFAGVLGGVFVLDGRYANLAPQASVFTSANHTAAPLLVDGKYNEWKAWDNGPDFRHPVTAATPEWIVLVWPRPVQLTGLAALWAGFNSADVQAFSGPDSQNPQETPESSWHSVGSPYSLRNQYPRPLGIDWMSFASPVTTRAIRLRITAVTDESHHQHLAGKTRNGTRVWLGELMALTPLQSNSVQSAILPPPADTSPKPPIPIRFTLDQASYVTLVIDDAKGNRVRNLVSNTWFEKGPNTVWWDGTDDLSRNPEAANHGQYLIPTRFVAPGTYHVRGLSHDAIDLRYEFSIYNPGHPAWETADTKGGWLTNHTPPSSALFVPQDKAPGGKPLVYLGSYVSEGGAGLAWVDLDGNKQGGRGWIGGNWTAAPFLARDSGPQADPDIYAYVAAPTGDATTQPGKPVNAIIRLTGLTKHGDKAILNFSFNPGSGVEYLNPQRFDWTNQMGGLAVRNNLAVVSLPLQNQLLFIDVHQSKSLGTASLPNAHGLAFDAQGHLLVLSGNRLIRFPSIMELPQFNPNQLATPEVLVNDLNNPAGITTDSSGNIYISEGGNSNQVRVFTQSGKFLHAIGHQGPSKAGPYDPLHMNHPFGLAIDSANHLWVAEDDFQPKRVSVWTLEGQFVKAFYGPSEYGGGGSLDPKDKTKFYYHAMQFKLDWATGANNITNILYRPGPEELPLPPAQAPKVVLYSGEHRYFTNSYLGHATNGPTIGMLFLDKNGTISPVAALGKANDWPLLRGEAFKSKLPPGSDLSNNSPDQAVLFAWSDTNENGKVDPEEVQFKKSTTGSINIVSDQTIPGPTMLDSYIDGHAVRFAPTKLSPSGVPTYDLSKSTIIANGAQRNASDGGGEVLDSPDNIVLTTAPLPFAKESLGGIDHQGHAWSYPSLWPGLHPSHSAPIPDRPGELVGTTHLLGSFVTPPGSTVDPIWAINGNTGTVYLFTADGLFVSQLFQDGRTGKPWNMPVATRNMRLNDLSLHEENFFPSLTQTADGKIYLVDGSRTSIIRVDGLSTLRKLPDSQIQVTADDLGKSQGFLRQREILRQSASGAQNMDVMIHSGAAPPLNDLAATFKPTDWVVIDRRITQEGWNQKPDTVEAAVSIAAGQLFASFRTSDPNLLTNSGTVANAPFKTGGALDLMIGVNPNADPKREKPIDGDIRLLVYQVNGKTQAKLYRAVVPGTSKPVPFSSPARTITLDQVEDVSDAVHLVAANGSFSFSVPLTTLGLKPVAGQHVKADIGVLRGKGVETTQRVYWSNKATGITSDVPSEAELTPNLWGDWYFKSAL